MKNSPITQWLICLLALTGMAAMLHRELRLLPDGNVHVHFLDVGQGDSALLVSPTGKQIVIDGGPDLAALEAVGSRMPFFDRSIDLLVLSHPNVDHLVALPSFLRRYRVEKILLTGIAYDVGRYEELIAAVEDRKPEIIFSDPAKDLDMGDGLLLDVLWPPKDIESISFKDVNDSSIVLKAMYGKESILFTGDIEEFAEKEILATGADLRSTVLKVAHHGGKTSSGTGFLLAVDPRLAIISVAANNSYGHPHPSILGRLKALQIPVQMTKDEGTISLKL
ncbi:MBL fold metallo-hydrolase [Candidatus Peregrinibacteria bacterium]|nr:MBL fold metallo-hydrolase [Candidatus Peregrinibacteria bacterium]